MTTAVAGGQRRRQFPDRHQDRKIPGNDLSDNAQRLMKVVGHRVVVEFAERAFLGAYAARKVAKMVDRQRQIGEIGLADRLAVVVGFDRGEERQILLHAVRNAIEYACALGHGGAAPAVGGRVRGIDCEFDVLGLGPGDLADHLAGGRGDVVEIAALDRGDPLAADEILIAGAQRNLPFDGLQVRRERGAFADGARN